MVKVKVRNEGMNLEFQDIERVAELPYRWDELKNKTVMISGGTGFIGWEYELAGIFLCKVHESIRKHEKYADITLLFERDLFGAEHGTLTKEQIYNHLIKWFEFVEKTDNCIKLKCNIVP